MMAAVMQAGIQGEDLAGVSQAVKVRIPSLTGTAAGPAGRRARGGDWIGRSPSGGP
jgi:hypothetical protein